MGVEDDRGPNGRQIASLLNRDRREGFILAMRSVEPSGRDRNRYLEKQSVVIAKVGRTSSAKITVAVEEEEEGRREWIEDDGSRLLH